MLNLTIDAFLELQGSDAPGVVGSERWQASRLPLSAHTAPMAEEILPDRSARVTAYVSLLKETGGFRINAELDVAPEDRRWIPLSENGKQWISPPVHSPGGDFQIALKAVM
ncbi:MAG: hypothetical protein J0L97_05415 [Alphaproteobacteria bacterium]|nr:hypothetical protein [Alphaproteobacteria bacterium]